MNITYADIKSKFIEKLENITIVMNPNEIDDKPLREDLRLLNFDIANIVFLLEDTYNVDTSDIAIEDLQTVRDIINMFYNEINKGNLNDTNI
jgi:acyl carrier protein